MNKHYTHVIIGGGIVGSGIFRDLSLHGEDVLLVDKGDFNSQTSQASSKMLHGGIRYLENFDFALVKEALHEKKTWTKLAPHLTKEEMFIIPVYKESKWPLFFVRIGLFLYDLLSLFKNPRFYTMNKVQTLNKLPELRSESLKGAGVYSDAIVEDAKLGLECIYDAINEKCHALNYKELIKVAKKDGKYQLSLIDKLNHQKMEVSCENLIFALGPFTDQVLKKLEIPWNPVMIPSKGSHIWIKKDSLNIKQPMVLQTSDNRIIFVIPQRDAILIGTTEIALAKDEDIFNIKASDEEIEYILQNVNEYFPSAELKKDCIIRSFAGVRPLVQDGSKHRSKVSRTHKVYNPTENIFVICGGKYTTFRVMAQDIVKMIFKKSGKRYIKDLSLRPLKKKSVIPMQAQSFITQDNIDEILANELPRTYEDLIYRRLSLIDPQDPNINTQEVKNLFKTS
tara:strand:- start:83721 stop:85076 length:1356 start_codon:yes stop_codon:yes gene_type:complete